MPYVRKVTQEDAELIRESHKEHLRLKVEANKLSVKALSAKFELSEPSIRDIITYRTYR